MCPVKEVIQTYSSKWMFTYTKYLSDQVYVTSNMSIEYEYIKPRKGVILTVQPTKNHNQNNQPTHQFLVSLTIVEIIFFLQVSSILNDLDSFLKRIEPGVEAITGKERDITSFMRLMGIFNEV